MDNLPLGTYYVRVKAHDTVLASDAQEIVIRGYFTATAKINGDAKYGETLSVSLENANSRQQCVRYSMTCTRTLIGLISHRTILTNVIICPAVDLSANVAVPVHCQVENVLWEQI